METAVVTPTSAPPAIRYSAVAGQQVINDYGDPSAEHQALLQTAGVLDLSFRGRLCLTGADRGRFLHGQVTNDIQNLKVGQGCYSVLTNAKGKMESDLNIYCLADELLLDFEPGLSASVSQRLEKYIVADDVQVVDVAPDYGLLSVQGPKAETALHEISDRSPVRQFDSMQVADSALGEVYVMNQPRLGSRGFDLFVPVASKEAAFARLSASCQSVGGRPCGWQALETARIEAGIPRYGADMDESNLAFECGIVERAVSFTKGCYIGQEVLNRLHTMGHVNKDLRRLRLSDNLSVLPAKDDKLFFQGKEVGYITSALASPTLKTNIALGYVRREANAVGTELVLLSQGKETPAWVVGLPFTPFLGD